MNSNPFLQTLWVSAAVILVVAVGFWIAGGTDAYQANLYNDQPDPAAGSGQYEWAVGLAVVAATLMLAWLIINAVRWQKSAPSTAPESVSESTSTRSAAATSD